VTVAALIETQKARLTPAERRVADIVLAHPHEVAFGTVAEIARRASTSGATVVRLATKLGLEGFSALQSVVQSEVAQRLRPAAERIREHLPNDVLAQTLAGELDNVQGTIEAAAPGAFDALVQVVADPARQVLVLSGDASRGVGLMLFDALAMLRPGVTLVEGTDVRVGRALADVAAGDVLLALDLRRYERWVLTAASLARSKGAMVAAFTDSSLSPLAELASYVFTVRAASPGPFDSHVGTLAIANALAVGVAIRLRGSATGRLDAIEASWTAIGALVDG
jgi:DNA-binding MurR/RpiR family transcriptional regulator